MRRRRTIHLHDKERTDQSRGKPIVVCVMRQLHMAGRYASNKFKANQANLLVAAILEPDSTPEMIS